MMCSNWIIPFVVGVFVGQEFQEAPKVRPYIEAGIRKIIQVGKEIADNTKHTTDKESDKKRERPSWWNRQNTEETKD